MSTHKPSTREEFKEFCLRRLGKPVIEVNVTDDQIEDALETALAFYTDYHYDGSLRTYLKHRISADDVLNKYITTPDEIIGVARVFPIVSTGNSDDILSTTTQLKLKAINDLAGFSLAPYVNQMMQYTQMEEILVGQTPIRFNRHMNRIYIDTSSESLGQGNYLLFEVYTSLNPSTYTDVWSDRILQDHCTALIKRQWGQNTLKYDGIQLPGGVTLNGRQIYDDAISEIQQIEDEYKDSYTMPILDIIR